MRGSRFRIATAACSVLALALPCGALAAGQPYAPYHHRIPFHCELQDVGTGVDYPDGRADPFCVEFDKTNQSISPDFGIVDFFANEPARTAAAVPKCFYFQRDHWTGSIVQGSGPELWNWRGNYFFDKAAAAGGVSVADFRVGGVPFDAAPYAPDSFQPYLNEGGGGGVLLRGATVADPSCAALVDTRAERRDVYRRWYRRALRHA